MLQVYCLNGIAVGAARRVKTSYVVSTPSLEGAIGAFAEGRIIVKAVPQGVRFASLNPVSTLADHPVWSI